MPIEISPDVFLSPKYIENTQTTQFTVDTEASSYIIDKATATNVTAGAVTFSVNLVPDGDTAGDDNLVIDEASVAAHATHLCPELVGQIMTPGEFLSAIASAATSITLRISGRRVR